MEERKEDRKTETKTEGERVRMTSDLIDFLQKVLKRVNLQETTHELLV